MGHFMTKLHIGIKLGYVIKQERESRGLTQADLAQRSGIDQGLLSKYESDRRVPDLETIVTLSTAMDGAPSLLVQACGHCPVAAALLRLYDMAIDDEIRVELMLAEQARLTDELAQIYATRPDRDSPDYAIYVVKVRDLMRKISVSASAYYAIFGLSPND